MYHLSVDINGLRHVGGDISSLALYDPFRPKGHTDGHPRPAAGPAHLAPGPHHLERSTRTFPDPASPL